MIILLAPSKTMDFTQPVNKPKSSPLFLKEAHIIANTVSKMNNKDFQYVAAISDELTAKTLDKFAKWGTSGNPKQRAMQAYVGTVYDGLSFKSWNLDDIDFAQKHLRILSGLYGYVRPCDLIEQYRLEMQTKLPVSESKDLYSFWNSKIADQIIKDQPNFILNATSNEYMKSIRKYLPKDLQIIAPKFLEEKSGKLKDVTIYTKVMRGIFTSWIIKSKITTVEELKSFNFGYLYSPELSSKDELVFTKRMESHANK